MEDIVKSLKYIIDFLLVIPPLGHVTRVIHKIPALCQYATNTRASRLDRFSVVSESSRGEVSRSPLFYRLLLQPLLFVIICFA